MRRSYVKYEKELFVFGVTMVVLLAISWASSIYRGVISPSARADEVVQELQLTEFNHSVKVPNLEGASLEEAQEVIESSGLDLGSVIYVHSPVPKGKILDQDQLPGAAVAPGWTINLSVSAGE